MKSAPKSLFPYLLLILLPTALVGWIGLNQMGRLSRELSDFKAEAEALLRGEKDRFQRLLENLIDRHLTRLAGLPRKEIEEELAHLPDLEQTQAIRFGFLLTGSRPVYPRVARNYRNTRQIPPLLPKVDQSSDQETAKRIWEAELLWRLTGEVDDAIGHLMNQETPYTNDPELNAMFGLLRGTLLRQQGKLTEALTELTTARQELEDITGRFSAIYLVLVLVESEIEKDLLPEESRRARLVELVSRTLDGIAKGRFDQQSDDFLSMVFDKLELIAESLADQDPALHARIMECRDRNTGRVALRQDMQLILNSGIVSQLSRGNRSEFTMPFSVGNETSLIAMLRIQDSQAEKLWAGIQVDLVTLYTQPTVNLEKVLSSTKQLYRIELRDDIGQAIIGDSSEKSDREREIAERMTTQLHLSGPLKGFSLAAIPRDPEAIVAEKRRGLLMRSCLLLALVAVAGTGAFLLTRTVRKEAELAQIKTTFVGRVSHELKTPLALVRMYAETMAMGRVKDPEKTSQFGSIIAREAERLTSMIENVLDFSRIDAGAKAYNKTITRLDLHLRSLLDSYAPHLEEHGFELTTNSFPALESNVDPEALTQSIVNLLGNARKYTADSGAKIIEVRLGAEDGRARIDVLDRGVGVPEGEQEQVFETFYRASTAGEHSGAGIGLALVKHFAASHGGEARCERRPDGGSVFSIFLRLENAPDGTSDQEGR
ncbi:MAG: sensor histidine kinase [Planctomycetota bacterium]